MVTHPEWYQFQEDICSYFISIGASVETNITVKGVRTTHDIDILVKTKYLGEDLTWIIEAKKWKSRVNKLQVLGLRTIADEIGADRAFIISEAGFQSKAKQRDQIGKYKRMKRSYDKLDSSFVKELKLFMKLDDLAKKSF